MSQIDALHDLFRVNGNRLTLRQMKEAWELIGSNETGRISDLRKRLIPNGQDIVCTECRDRPSENTYEIVRVMEPSGQRLLA